MQSWTLLFLGLFHCFFDMATTQQQRNKALFPIRMKRGLSTMRNPIFHKSLDDVDLLYEILLSGLYFDDHGRGLWLRDAELASLRKTQELEVLCGDALPRELTDVRRLASRLLGRVGSLGQGDFERTLLTMVYTAQHVIESPTDHQRDVWAESFVGLFKAIKEDLKEER
ncbi:protein FAM180A [Gadus morhua]|uniref:protein FAM180A n=1 Tax=Gadus morhua TaxID=8049 RepID=UPI0011B3F37D|nr:protein FAM180A-like [Gadus morhua]